MVISMTDQLPNPGMLKMVRRIRNIVYIENLLIPIASVLASILFYNMGAALLENNSISKHNNTYYLVKFFELLALTIVGFIFGIVQCIKSKTIVAQIAMDNEDREKELEIWTLFTGLRTTGTLKYGIFEIGAWLLVILSCVAFLITKYTSIADRWFSPD
jgi:hypothetical protein